MCLVLHLIDIFLLLIMKFWGPLILAFIFLHYQVRAQIDSVGSGHSIRFDGFDDYIDMGNIYDNLQFPITISAWVFVEPSSNYILPIFVTQDNTPIYNGFWFCLSATNLFIEYGDGRGEQNDAFRKGKSAPLKNIVNRWVYVSAVIKNANDIQLYANGYNIGGKYTGLSSLPMASAFPADVAKAGYYYTNSATHHFKGIMDELRIWNRSLSENEIRETMCRRLKGNEMDLIGYWNFDETSGDVLKDLSPNRFNGILKGNPERVFSGAPVGDESVFLYTNNWTGKSLSKNGLSVAKVYGNPYGVHIYTVNHIPSQTGNLEVPNVQLPYFGVFLADDGETNAFDLAYIEKNVCTSFQRKDNSESDWYTSDFLGIHSRLEIIPGFKEESLDVDLGEDVNLCDQSSLMLKPFSEPGGKSFLWNTGSTSSTLMVTSSGSFWVEVQEGCKVDRDTIQVSFAKTPPAFSLGEDELLCTPEPRTLSPNLDLKDFDFTWQDGSTEKSLRVMNFGTYWLKIQNACGFAADSITFAQKTLKDFQSYNFISPNQDAVNQFFVVDELLAGAHLVVFSRWGKQVYESLNYQNNWDGGGLPTGIYFYTIHGECFETQKGTLTIMH